MRWHGLVWGGPIRGALPASATQLAATRLRREHGIDVAQTILGHRIGSHITEIYAEANVAKAIDVIAKVG